MKEFDVFVSGKATFTWSDCNGGGSETKQLYPGATPTGMSCEFSPFSYACSLSGQNADYKTSVSLTINSGTTPKLTTISGTCVRNVFLRLCT